MMRHYFKLYQLFNGKKILLGAMVVEESNLITVLEEALEDNYAFIPINYETYIDLKSYVELEDLGSFRDLQTQNIMC